MLSLSLTSPSATSLRKNSLPVKCLCDWVRPEDLTEKVMFKQKTQEGNELTEQREKHALCDEKSGGNMAGRVF